MKRVFRPDWSCFWDSHTVLLPSVGVWPQVIPIQWLREVLFGSMIPGQRLEKVKVATCVMDLMDLRAIEIIRQWIRTNSAGNPTISLLGQVGSKLSWEKSLYVNYDSWWQFVYKSILWCAVSPKNPLRRLSKQAIEVLSGANNMNQYSWAHGYLLVVIE